MQSGTEPDLKEFFFKIIRVVTALVVWALITMFFGLYLQWAFVYGRFNVFNAIFYIWFVASLTGLVYYFYKVWKQ
ncbi:MAG: hypothetical protein J0H29_14970 [Sphingobacteriales bacterium]|nr:hypothetical protein [Sphingobacteriales bacterium]OJY87425.1 MAG: hypothetical protein BGP14_08790 [Sphingobacteriales bacterium 44-15]